MRQSAARALLVQLTVAVTLAGCFFTPISQGNPPVPQPGPTKIAGLKEPEMGAPDRGSVSPFPDSEDHPADLDPELPIAWEWGVRWGITPSGGALLPRRVHPLRGIVAVAAGLEHGLALSSDGTVWTWGNGRPLLGGIAADGPTDRPRQVAGLADVVAIAAGDFHNLAVRSDGTVWSWGHNGSGQLGDGSRESRSTAQMLEGLEDVVAITAGMSHSLALRRDGTVRAWGDGLFGAMGNGSRVSSLTPAEVAGLTDVISIAAGGRHSLVARADGTVWGWGRGDRGEIGVVADDSTVPTQIEGLSDVVLVAAGWRHSMAVTAEGELYSWGENEFGQLGHGKTGGMISLPEKVEDLPPVVSAVGGDHFSAAMTVDGQVFIWGDDVVTSLRRGDGTRSSPATPRPVAALHHITQVAAHSSSVIVIQSDVERRLETPRFVRGAR